MYGIYRTSRTPLASWGDSMYSWGVRCMVYGVCMVYGIWCIEPVEPPLASWGVRSNQSNPPWLRAWGIPLLYDPKRRVYGIYPRIPSSSLSWRGFTSANLSRQLPSKGYQATLVNLLILGIACARNEEWNGMELHVRGTANDALFHRCCLECIADGYEFELPEDVNLTCESNFLI